jgi:transposase, IS5 family
MARRQVGQESFRFGAKVERKTSLDELHALIDWAIAQEPLAALYKSPKGEKAWPPLAMFKALLLATWHNLSDVALAEALSDRASFRRFCGFARGEATPERTAFVRFRRELIARGLDRSLFSAIARDLESKGATVRKGTLIDATVIGSASKSDQDASWVKHKSRAPAHGYKAHIAADKDTGIIRDVETTPANEADVTVAPMLIPDAPGEVYADKAYDALSGRSKPKVEHRSSCARAIAGSRPKRSRRTTAPCGRSGRGSKKFLALGNVAITSDACDGWAWPKPSAKSISPPSLTTSSAIGGCKEPERTAKQIALACRQNL